MASSLGLPPPYPPPLAGEGRVGGVGRLAGSFTRGLPRNRSFAQNFCRRVGKVKRAHPCPSLPPPLKEGAGTGAQERAAAHPCIGDFSRSKFALVSDATSLFMARDKRPMCRALFDHLSTGRHRGGNG